MFVAACADEISIDVSSYIPTFLARGLSHAPLLFVRRERSGSRDINFLLLSLLIASSLSTCNLSLKIKTNNVSLYPLYYSSIAQYH